MKKEIISAVCWKWRSPAERDKRASSEFRPEHVNILRASFERNYPEEHRFICITDDPTGLDPRIETYPCPVTFEHVPAPAGVRYPSSYRRLWNFSEEARELLGPRIFHFDVDSIFTGDLRKLLSAQEDFVSWYDNRFEWKKIPGGIYLLRTGTHTHVWDRFDPAISPQVAARAGCKGSDQGWLSHLLFPAQRAWGIADGVYSIKWLDPRKGLRRRRVIKGGRVHMGTAKLKYKEIPLPSNCVFVATPGFDKPWTPELQEVCPWIREHWRL